MTKNYPLIRKRMGLREIARELNEKGVPTTGGGKWYAGPLSIYWKTLFIKG